LSTTVFGHKFAAPLMAGAITGGTHEATKINATIAEAVEELGLGMGVGSQRAALEDRKLEESFAVARKKAPTAFLVANIGGVQLVNGIGLKKVRRAMQMVEADALAIHLNALQETAQPEGQTNFAGILEKVARIAEELEKPVIVKETGAGMAAEDAKKLEAAGVKGIDVSGAGGTSWAAVEYYRAKELRDTSRQRLGNLFWDWGIPTAASLVEASQTVNIPIIASGGIRSGEDIAKSLTLGSSLTSLSQPILRAAVKGTRETKYMLSLLMDELRNVMFLTGAASIEDLHNAQVVVVGKTADWLRTRGFGIESYARRGRN
jgi:isopentenyl-diphosphate delta-isomerase